MKYAGCTALLILTSIIVGCTKTNTTNGNTTGGSGTPTSGTGGSVAAPVTVTVAANTVTTNSFTASWAKVPSANSYLVYVASDSLFTQPLSSYNPTTVTDTNLVVSNLTSNTSYYFRVKASVSGVTSDFSKTVTATTQAIAKKWQTVGSASFRQGAVVYNTGYTKFRVEPLRKIGCIKYANR
jgi:phosphodiesterase/alkaline phosphatase D-like protein